MELSKAQLEYIQAELNKTSMRLKDLDSFGDKIYENKNVDLFIERNRIRYDRWFYNNILKLHSIEVKAKNKTFEELKRRVEEQFKDDVK